jgi:hypothetical protein
MGREDEARRAAAERASKRAVHGRLAEQVAEVQQRK